MVDWAKYGGGAAVVAAVVGLAVLAVWNGLVRAGVLPGRPPDLFTPGFFVWFAICILVGMWLRHRSARTKGGGTQAAPPGGSP